MLRTRHIEFKLANPPNVNSDPAVEIEIFRPVRAGICHRVSLANLLEPAGSIVSMTRFVSSGKRFARKQSESMFSCASQALAIDQFSYFMAKLHSSHLVAKHNNFN